MRSPTHRSLTPEQFKQIFPHASKSTIAANADNPASAPILERRSGDGPLATPQAQASDTRIYSVRVTSYRVRLLDEDNLCEKYHVDGCRYAGLLPSDAPGRARIITTQKKVAKKNQEKTLIEVS